MESSYLFQTWQDKPSDSRGNTYVSPLMSPAFHFFGVNGSTPPPAQSTQSVTSVTPVGVMETAPGTVRATPGETATPLPAPLLMIARDMG